MFSSKEVEQLKNLNLNTNKSQEDTSLEELSKFSKEIEKKSSLQQELVKLSDQEYRKLVHNLINLLKGPLYWDKKFDQLWIYKIEITFPENQLNFKNNNLSRGKISEEITPEEVRRFRNKANELREKLKSRAELAGSFFSKDWKHKDLRSDSDFFRTNISFQIKDMFSNNPLKQQVLRFSREDKDNSYYLDVYFYSKVGENQLQLSMVNYKDKSWNSSAYYQANGAWSKWRNHIGGSSALFNTMGYDRTEIDIEFSRMFKDFNENPNKALKFFDSISKCLEDRECATLFETDRIPVLNKREPGIDRVNSWDPKYYRNIHPFSRIYYETQL